MLFKKAATGTDMWIKNFCSLSKILIISNLKVIAIKTKFFKAVVFLQSKIRHHKNDKIEPSVKYFQTHFLSKNHT